MTSHKTRGGKISHCASMMRNFISVAPRRCAAFFLRSHAPCAGARSRTAGGHFQRPNPCQQAGSPLLLHQARSRPAGIPSYPAISLNGRPLFAKSPKASRLNSSVYRRRTIPIKHLPAPKGAYQRCPPFRRRVSGPCLDFCGCLLLKVALC
jgi:hypothetical protein